jgi:hypothetical protein
MRKSLKILTLLLVLAPIGFVVIFAGCESYRNSITGHVNESVAGDSLIIKYDISYRIRDIDSVALQLLPDSWDVNYPEEVRIRDSLIRSLGDSLRCCREPGWSVSTRTSDSSGERPALVKDTLACWWYTLSINAVDSILKIAQIDSLRRRSVPCWWQVEGASVDTAIQADSIIYRSRDGLGNYRTRSTGRLVYRLAGKRVPTAYCLKIFVPTNGANWFLEPNPIWKGIIPRRPTIWRYPFREHGRYVGMEGGIGASKFDRGGIRGSSHDHTYMPFLGIGFLYYCPTTIYQFSGQLFGIDSTGEPPSLTSSFLGLRYYLCGRNSIGPSILGGLEYTNFIRGTGSERIEKNDLGAAVGIGYENSFDRATYIYHSGQGGYHELEVLVGMTAIQQGKAGLKLSIQRGGGIRFATIQAYMENRIDFRTMVLHSRRSLLVQALIYSGLAAGWLLVN